MRTVLTCFAVCSTLAVCSLLANRLTRSYCVRLNVFHAAAAVEDGMLWFEFPLERRVNGQPFRSSAIRVFVLDATAGTSRIPELWRSGPRHMVPTRDLVRESKRTTLAAGFGWYHDDGYIDANLPGQSIGKLRLIAPIWFALAGLVAITVGLRHKRQFGIGVLMLATAALAAVLWFIVVPAA